MTLTLDLTPTEEARLLTAARQAGVAPDALLKRYVNSLSSKPPAISPEEKPSREQKPAVTQAGWEKPSSLQGLGMFAHVPGGSEQYAQEKQAQILQEERSRG